MEVELQFESEDTRIFDRAYFRICPGETVVIGRQKPADASHSARLFQLLDVLLNERWLKAAHRFSRQHWRVELLDDVLKFTLLRKRNVNVQFVESSACNMTVTKTTRVGIPEEMQFSPAPNAAASASFKATRCVHLKIIVRRIPLEVAKACVAIEKENERGAIKLNHRLTVFTYAPHSALCDKLRNNSFELQQTRKPEREQELKQEPQEEPKQELKLEPKLELGPELKQEPKQELKQERRQEHEKIAASTSNQDDSFARALEQQVTTKQGVTLMSKVRRRPRLSLRGSLMLPPRPNVYLEEESAEKESEEEESEEEESEEEFEEEGEEFEEKEFEEKNEKKENEKGDKMADDGEEDKLHRKDASAENATTLIRDEHNADASSHENNESGNEESHNESNKDKENNRVKENNKDKESTEDKESAVKATALPAKRALETSPPTSVSTIEKASADEPAAKRRRITEDASAGNPLALLVQASLVSGQQTESLRDLLHVHESALKTRAQKLSDSLGHTQLQVKMTRALANSEEASLQMWAAKNTELVTTLDRSYGGVVATRRAVAGLVPLRSFVPMLRGPASIGSSSNQAYHRMLQQQLRQHRVAQLQPQHTRKSVVAVADEAAEGRLSKRQRLLRQKKMQKQQEELELQRLRDQVRQRKRTQHHNSTTQRDARYGTVRLDQLRRLEALEREARIPVFDAFRPSNDRAELTPCDLLPFDLIQDKANTDVTSSSETPSPQSAASAFVIESKEDANSLDAMFSAL
ncbi:MAG: hypothetical protein MHM6MM_005268 [Cercozoa sp. M6MM]